MPFGKWNGHLVSEMDIWFRVGTDNLITLLYTLDFKHGSFHLKKSKY